MTYKAKKYLGQNFLKSIPALNKIVEAGEISKEDIVLEIGPGKGALTEKLLEKAGRVVAVEKDRELFELLKEKFSGQISEKKLILINDDILKIDMSKGIFDTKYKIIANIPYNITGAILKKFLTDKNQPKTMVLMVQNEVAKRIMARDPRHGGAGGKESILSISVKAYGSPQTIIKVPARYFSPAPKVDSAVIAINNISREFFIKNKINEELFWEIIRAGFAHKRKKLSSNLEKYEKNTPTDVLGNKRAEELELSDWINLAKTIFINKKE